VSLYRLLLTCLWTVSLGVFVVYLDAERVRMQSEMLEWEGLRAKVVGMRQAAVYDFWRTFHYAVPGEPLKTYLNGPTQPAPEVREWEDLH
jgi:hypothetical protein